MDNIQLKNSLIMTRLKIAVGVFVLMASVWLLFCHFGHELIRAMHEGRFTGSLNKFMQGQAVFPVEYYLKLVDKLFLSLIFLIILALLTMYFVIRLYLALRREKKTILLGIMLLVTISLIASFGLFGLNIGNAVPLMTGVKDWMAVYEERFSGLKTLLSGNEIVGYMAEEYGWEIEGGNTAKYYQTRYALSPVLIDKNRRTGLIIGNFKNDQSPAKLKKNGLIVIKDFGNGLMLLKKSGEEQ